MLIEIPIHQQPAGVMEFEIYTSGRYTVAFRNGSCGIATRGDDDEPSLIKGVRVAILRWALAPKPRQIGETLVQLMPATKPLQAAVHEQSLIKSIVGATETCNAFMATFGYKSLGLSLDHHSSWLPVGLVAGGNYVN
jgi:hypothetical protein